MFPSAVSQRTVIPEHNTVRSTLRIASLLPGLTDVIHDLKLTDNLVATSHECNHPPTAKALTRPKLPTSGLTLQEITSGWNALAGHPLCDALATRICSFYTVDVDALRGSCPSILLTHLTPPHGFEPSQEAVLAALESLIPGVKVISTNPTCLREIYQLYHDVAQIAGTSAIMSVASTRTRLRKLPVLPIAQRPRVAVVQWTEPLYLAGDWVPEIVTICAQSDGLTSPGLPSTFVQPSALRNVDIVLFAVCALDLDACSKVIERFWKLNRETLSGWSGRLVSTDATRLFSRVALSTVVTSAEVLAEVVMSDARYGHKGVLWADWQPS